VNWMSTVVSEATGTLRRASDGLKIAVNQDNILQAARIIESEAEHFKKQVVTRADDMRVYEMGGDPVSAEVARVLTRKFVLDEQSYVNRCLDYAAMLKNLAWQLCRSAQTYGFNEEEVRAQFVAAEQEGMGRPLDLAPTSRAHRGGLRAI